MELFVPFWDVFFYLYWRFSLLSCFFYSMTLFSTMELSVLSFDSVLFARLFVGVHSTPGLTLILFYELSPFSHTNTHIHTHWLTHIHSRTHTHKFATVKEHIAVDSKIQSGVGRDGQLSLRCKSVWRNSRLLDFLRETQISNLSWRQILALIHKSPSSLVACIMNYLYLIYKTEFIFRENEHL